MATGHNDQKRTPSARDADGDDDMASNGSGPYTVHESKKPRPDSVFARELEHTTRALRLAAVEKELAELKEAKLAADMKSMSLGASAALPALSRSAQISIKMETLGAAAAQDADISPEELAAADNAVRDANTLARFVLGLNFSNPYVFGRVPYSSGKTVQKTSADGNGVQARILSRQLAVGRALALQQKYLLWHNEWRTVCNEIAEYNQRIIVLESNLEMQQLKRELNEAKRDETFALRATAAAAAVKAEQAVAAVSVKLEAAALAGTKRKAETAQPLGSSRELAKQARFAATVR